MRPWNDNAPLSADEHLKFTAIVERSTIPAQRRKISEALGNIRYSQGRSTCDAWCSQVQKMWR